MHHILQSLFPDAYLLLTQQVAVVAAVLVTHRDLQGRITGQLLGPVLAQQFMDLVTLFGLIVLQEGLADERGQKVGGRFGPRHHLPGRFPREPAPKHGQLGEHNLLRLVEPLPRGTEHSAHAALPLGDVAPFRLQKVQALLRLSQDFAQGEGVSPRRGQFQRQGHAFHQTANARHHSRIVWAERESRLDAAHSLHKQLDRRVRRHVSAHIHVCKGRRRGVLSWICQTMDRKQMLTLQLELLARCDQELDAASTAHDVYQQVNPRQ